MLYRTKIHQVLAVIPQINRRVFSLLVLIEVTLDLITDRGGMLSITTLGLLMIGWMVIELLALWSKRWINNLGAPPAPLLTPSQAVQCCWAIIIGGNAVFICLMVLSSLTWEVIAFTIVCVLITSDYGFFAIRTIKRITSNVKR